MKILRDSPIDFDNKLIVSRESAVDKKKYESIIPITSDGMFKTLFGREECIKFPCKLLSYIVDMSYEDLLKKLHFSKNETGKKNRKERAYRNDLVVVVDDTTINIEMNNNASEEVRDRNFEYLMRIRNDKRNSNYTPVIQININNYSYENDSVVRRDYAIMSNDNILLTNNIVIVDIYLPNIKKKSYNNNNNLSEMERFLLIGIEENRKKALEYVGDDIVMKDFDELIKEKSLDDDLYEAYDKEWALRDQAERDGYQSGYEIGINDGLKEGMKKGLEEGRTKGLEEGREEVKKEIIKKLIEKGLSDKEISEILEIDIKKIKDTK